MTDGLASAAGSIARVSVIRMAAPHLARSAGKSVPRSGMRLGAPYQVVVADSAMRLRSGRRPICNGLNRRGKELTSPVSLNSDPATDEAIIICRESAKESEAGLRHRRRSRYF